MQKSKKIRLVVDVNVWISSLLSLGFRVRLDIVFSSACHLVVSEDLFNDFASVLRKPYLMKKITRPDYEILVAKLRSVAELVDAHSVVEICRDPKDNFLLALAKDGDADYLITGDDDLLVLKEFGKTRIGSLTDFEEISSINPMV